MAEILYADDDELFRELVRSVLEASGHSVRVVTNGDQALRELQDTIPDLVLLDYRMGEPDGFAVCRQIKRDPKYGHTPVLILTAEGEIDQRLEGFEAGADDYLAKPFDPRELRARVRALLELSRRGLERNPSSGLPGGEAINNEFERRRDTGEGFAICYLDLDNFKPFGERFGFPVSDAVIGEMGDLLVQIAQGSDAFAGHVGGDDFILFCDTASARSHVERLQALFLDKVTEHVPTEIAEAGIYTGKDRNGLTREFPLTAVSAAILYLPASYAGTIESLGQVVSDVKDRAKREGSGQIAEVDIPAG
jgi:DNA-binding response OmpR family regulator